jgi:dTDP-4-amino-4,6-dideoxygalactose transaminase
LPQFLSNSEINYSGFYFTVPDRDEAEKLRIYLNSAGIQALSHYLDLSQSPFILKTQAGKPKTNNFNSLKYQDTLLRLPLYHDLSDKSIVEITDSIKTYYKND